MVTTIRQRLADELNLWSPQVQDAAEDALNLPRDGMLDFLERVVLYATGETEEVVES